LNRKAIFDECGGFSEIRLAERNRGHDRNPRSRKRCSSNTRQAVRNACAARHVAQVWRSSGISERYIAQLESGKGNVSSCAAPGVACDGAHLEDLIPPPNRRSTGR